MQVTKHFRREEFDCRDGTIVPPEFMANLNELCENLEVLRASLTDKLKEKRSLLPGIKEGEEASIRVNSGYRTFAYQLRVNPKVTDSQHLYAKAADITSKWFTPRQIARAIEELIAAGLMKQGGIGIYPGFVHYDTRGTKARW